MIFLILTLSRCRCDSSVCHHYFNWFSIGFVINHEFFLHFSVPETTRSVWIRKEDSSRVKENKTT
jgi:hypothetical protein